MSDFYNVLPADSVAEDLDRRGGGAIPSRDNGLLVTFYEREHFMGYESKIQGRRVTEMRPYIKIYVDDKSIVERPMTSRDKLKYPKQWAAYESNKDSHGIVGTMLDDYAKASGNLNSDQLNHMRDSKIFTVEQLAEVSDVHAQSIGGQIRKHRTDACVWLEELKQGTVERKLMREIDDLKAKYDNATQSLSEVDTSKYEKDLEAAQAQNAALAEMNKEILDQFKGLSEEMAALKVAKEEKPKKKGK